MKALYCLVAGVVAVAACGGDGGSKNGITVRDSASVAIVDHDSTALGKAAQFTIGTPVLSIGGDGADSMHNPGRMYSAVLVGDGRFVVLDARANRVVLFDSTGAVKATWGKRGDGPTAFSGPGGLRLTTDGLVQVVDFPARVVQFSATDLTVQSESKVGPTEPVFAVILHRTSPGSAIAVESEADQSGGRNRQYLVRIRRDGVDTLTTWQGDDNSRFGRRALARAWGNGIVVAGLGWNFTVRDSIGVVKREVVIHQAARPVTPAMRDSSLARDRRQLEGASAEDKAVLEEMIKAIKFADSVAAFDDFVEGRDGTLWASESVVTDDTDRFYSVFDAEGKLTRRIKIPAKQKLLAADGDMVVVRWLDGTHLELHRLVAVPAAAKP